MTKVVKSTIFVKEVRKKTEPYEHTRHPHNNYDVRIVKSVFALYTASHSLENVTTALKASPRANLRINKSDDGETNAAKVARSVRRVGWVATDIRHINSVTHLLIVEIIR